MAAQLSTVRADDATVVITGPEGYEVLSVSKNGKWAVLYSGSAGAVWDIENDVVTYLGDGTVTTYVQGVSDDGVVVGEFAFEDIDASTSGTTVTGGIYKDGVFIPLLDEDGNWIQSTGYGISSDGQYVCGCIWLSSYKVAPALWNPDGTMIHRLTVEATQGCANYVNNDGVCGGWYFHSDGERTNRQSCLWNADNEIVPITEDEDDISGYYNTYGLSDNGLYACAAIGVSETDSLYTVEGQWIKGVVYDIEAGEITATVPSTLYQVMDDGTVMYNTYADTTGVNESYMLMDGDTIPVIDYIEQVWGSSLPEDNDPHLFTAYFSEDRTRLVGTSYLADGSATIATAFISGVSEYPDVRNLTVKTLHRLTDRVVLRWKEPFINADEVTSYNIYARVSSDDEWETVGQAATGSLLSIASLPSSGATADSITFKVTAVYGDYETSGVTVAMSTDDLIAGYAQAPGSVCGYVFNYDDVALMWQPAESGASANVRLHSGTMADTFGASEAITFQAATLYDSAITACYSDDYTVTGVQFYYNTAVDTLQLIIYADGEAVYSQAIDQESLTGGSFNNIELDSALTLPAVDVMVALRVVISDAGVPLGLDGGPAVEGGDQLSEDDGLTWSTLRSLSGGTYDSNFLISLLLSDGDNPTVTGYNLYRDGELIATADADGDYEYVDKGVGTGSRQYGVGAVWSDDSEGQATATVSLPARTADRCPAPVNVTATLSSDSSSVTVEWEMPRQSELTYSNWSYRGMGEMVSGLTGWFQGIQYTAAKMRPYDGAEITAVNFYPISDCDFAIHIYEDGEEVGYKDIETYTLDTLNSITLDEAVAIEAGKEYIIAIEGFDVATSTAFLGNDDGSVSGYNVYSEDGETYYTDTYNYGNYMIGAMITCPGDNSFATTTYNVYVDTAAVATDLTDMTCTTDISSVTEPAIYISVGAVYSVGEKMSDKVQVVLDEEALGISQAVTGRDAAALTTVTSRYNLGGQRVGSSNAPGIYIERYADGTVRKKVKK